ncbi:hypothetical protein [Photobacterium phosphoreum]|uniref:hypothetical protein n=1 Tax=Photobacterium phosphoreum TaxID=659 RepID=UPI000D166C65|nr:hypothetical protein [Photobacterium phosphoreum]PTB33409.1 hypothetical protein DAT36_06990 [Photobacterium phosphoreum]
MVILALKKYFIAFIFGVVFIWGVLFSSVYLKNKHTGSLTIIFPSSQSDTRLKLLSIGEMSTNNRSIFSNMKIDPKETYKEIIMSDGIREQIANDLDLSLSNIPIPKIKNIPQTPLIKISMKTDYKDNLLLMLDSLLYNLKNKIREHRVKYIDFRSRTNKKQIEDSKLEIDLLSEEIRDIRIKYNLLHSNSNDYYANKIHKLEDLFLKKKIELISLKTQLEQFENILNLTPEDASLALLINSDYILKDLYNERANAFSRISSLSVSSGNNNPEFKIAKKEYQQLTININHRLSLLNKSSNDSNTKNLILSVDIDERSEIFKVYVLNEIKYHTVVNEFNQLDIEIKELKKTAVEVLSKYNDLQMLTKKLELNEAIYFSKLGNEQAYIDDAESIYPDVQIWNDAKIVGSKNKYIYIIVIFSGVFSTIIWIVILCIYYKKHHLIV